MSAANTVCIYCGAHSGNSEAIVTQARELAALLANRGFDLVYGGGNSGLMGIVANEFLQADRKVVGIRPQKLIRDEFAHPGITELIVVQDMHERKLKMIDAADIHIALPGGAGTLDELIEVFTQTKIGFVRKTCAILNTDHYYDELLAFFDKMVRFAFLRPEDRNLLVVENSPADLVSRLG
ncbi:LOG family protein [Flavilitoribacter nigricans]|uniref:Cytokinin riboside 5'-monophosphate phosphoribohydrolase n=1 Tax=Flavilitoribacter nigricans (strain ATCC 23147 / DSM 23189 / NBRC 102662 / NCIMB 1420 / SS-2) TaxID=1122177 RepID=A0A2D0N3U4_FLAN2|nr:TIGR00730 family Rossman fold protein [Flavilitoribacter nigricans]PHN03191.1 TIGR00730 family Rossman fold protein [Flavilitoribacter nigricans DSM 23189 = NBRC 102662]